ncbi:hypothetical protein F5Y04DRAFT_248001 [Hypomontagnella monticulosa]|nr:hypothetical protein F5Y04DRAFT_248001 [Hypomontagnella monticulosa]
MHTKVETSPYHSTAIEDSSAVTVQPNLNQYDLDTRGHYPVQRTGFSCVECNRSFPNQTALNEHGERGKHGCVACSCGAKFARQDVLNRHCTSFRKDASKFPCKFCKRHRGNRAFRRRDHLVQHLQGYHKFDSEEILKICPKYRTSYAPHHLICPDPSCESSLPKKVGRVRSDTLFPFKKQSDYNKHLRDVHKLTPFPCPVAECERVGAKGYVAENGLMKHLANQHPDAPQHLAIFREQLQGGDIVCDRCGKGLSLVEFNIHCRLAH